MGSKVALRTLATLFLALVLTGTFCLTSVAAKPNVLTVPDPYPSIHEAIDAASAGDTIIVSEGFYSEGEIEVHKPLTLIAEGEVIVDGEWLYYPWEEFDRIRAVFLVTSNNVIIRGFTVVNTWLWGAPGILVYNVENGRHVNNCRIEENRLQHNYFGAFIIGFENVVKENSFGHNRLDVLLGGLGADPSGSNVVENNLISDSGIGILVHGNSNHNTIKKNSIIDNSGVGIFLHDGTHDNTVSRNVATYNLRGIDITSSHRNTVQGNIASRNEAHGISLYGSSECNVIRGNTVSNNGHAGIYLQEGSHNIIRKNKVKENQDGIYLESSDYNTIEKNIVMKNIRYGIAVTMESDYNTINRNLALHNLEFDLYWDGTGTDNIWNNNIYKTKNW